MEHETEELEVSFYTIPGQPNFIGIEIFAKDGCKPTKRQIVEAVTEALEIIDAASDSELSDLH